MNAVVSKRMITASEYHQMGEVGIIRPEERVELINGEIITMSPIGSKHAAVVNRLMGWLLKNYSDQFDVSVQNPLRLDNHTEPEPDVALLKKHPTTYFEELPTASDATLVIEVSDTTFLYDTTTKLELYANAGIPEYWVVDIENARVFAFSESAEGTYKKSQTYLGTDAIQYEGLTLNVSDIIPQKQG
ncbi:MAG: Uma2 family endonuclease [Cytophagales bacterium]|nr:Uma2 family endonuclease [Cytophagales bacterium]